MEKTNKTSGKTQTESVGVAETQKVSCYECGKLCNGRNMHRWYHGDQDDLVCTDCGKNLTHNDTAYAGSQVVENDN